MVRFQNGQYEFSMARGGSFLIDESGASAAEYALLLSVLGGCIAAALIGISAAISTGMTNAGANVARADGSSAAAGTSGGGADPSAENPAARGNNGRGAANGAGNGRGNGNK